MEPGMRDPTLPPEMQERIGDGVDWKLFEGMDGIPFRTQESAVPLYKEGDPEHRRPQITNELDIKVFDMAKPDDVNEYRKILNFCAQGLGRVIDREIKYVEETKNWRVFMSWAKYFWEDARETQKGNKKYYGGN